MLIYTQVRYLQSQFTFEKHAVKAAHCCHVLVKTADAAGSAFSRLDQHYALSADDI
jgi:hypothetical protein